MDGWGSNCTGRGPQGALDAALLQPGLCLTPAHVGRSELVAQDAARVAGIGNVNDALVEFLRAAKAAGFVVPLAAVGRELGCGEERRGNEQRIDEMAAES